VKKCLSILIVILFFLNVGCTDKTNSDNAKVTTKISVDIDNTIKKVAKIYGENNPQITEIKTTQEEVTKKPMYIVFLKGNFLKGVQKSHILEFSMTGDGKKVWALTSDTWQETEVNIPN
jgi:hypothetical protein